MANSTACPKCGVAAATGTVICPVCDFILDTSFLGDDFLNQPTVDGLVPGAHQPSDFGGEAMILGSLGSHDLDVEDEALGFESLLGNRSGSFLVAETNAGMRVIEPAPVYVDRSTQAMLESNAVLGQKPAGIGQALLSPFEQHVLSFIDGQRPVARVCAKAGLSMSDTKIALALLADRGLIVLVGTAHAPDLRAQLAGVLDDSDEGPGLSPFDGFPTSVNSVADALNEATLPVDDDGIMVSALPMPVPMAVPMPLPSTTAPVRSSMTRATTPAPTAAPMPIPVSLPTTATRPPTMAPIPVSLPTTATRPPTMAPTAAVAVDGASEAAREKGLALYEMALTDLRGGKKARAHMYAKMAREACPMEPRIVALLDNWHQAEQHARSETDDQRLFAEAQRAEEGGDFPKAIGLLRQAIAKNAGAAELHNRLGVILATRLGDHSGASSALMRAVELAPQNMVYRSNLGKVFKMSEGKAVGALIADGASAVPTTTTAARPVSMLDRLRNSVRK